MGGAAQASDEKTNTNSAVSIAGAILWGVLRGDFEVIDPAALFQSQGRFFGGCCPGAFSNWLKDVIVSIAGAILWGVLPEPASAPTPGRAVSIAGAILWGVLPTFEPAVISDMAVSIAGAILWGVLRESMPHPN